ncbi:MAG: hypothetical protein H7257_13465 [Taibaiella sp.]|nr:hypothetical protein [Taibaiella sp.]
MKKVMISSGVFAATALTAGIAFKYMQWNGASIMMTVGILTASLIFLPLLFMLKMKEEQEAKNKLLLTLGTLSAIMMAMAILFKVQHWPGANAMGVASPAILALVFLPVYFFTGIRNAATKVNTIVTSVLIIVGCGLFFTITPKSIALITIRNTNSYLRSEQILKNEAINLAQLAKTDTANIPDIELGNKVYNTCEELKGYLLQYATGGSKTIDGDFESKEVFIRDANTQDYLSQNPAAAAKLDELAKAVTAYNNATAKNGLRSPIPMSYTIVNTREHKVLDKVTSALNDLLQVQMLVLQNRIELYAAQNDKGLTALK